VQAGEDGFMDYPMNPTDKAAGRQAEHPQRLPHDGAAGGNGPWSQALGADALLVDVPRRDAPGLPRVTPPDVWFVYRTNPAISFWDTQAWREDRALPVHRRLRLHARRDQPLRRRLLPDATDLESLQLIRIGGTKFVEQFWDHEGFALRQPAVAPRGQARDFTDIATELAGAPACSKSTTPPSTAAPAACR
jgi:phenylacetyl-CoA:acceptor oxidoreductase